MMEEEYPFERLGSFLTTHNHVQWCQQQHPLELHRNFEIIIDQFLTKAFNDLHLSKIRRYSDLQEHSERAKYYGLRLLRILENVEQSPILQDEYSIIRFQFLRFEKHVEMQLGLQLGLSQSMIKIDSVNFDHQNSESQLLKFLISKHLGHFSGVGKDRKRIMTDVQYGHLTASVEETFTTQKVIEIPEKFKRIEGITNDSLCHSFYLLMKEYFSNGKTCDFVILYLLKNFQQLESYEFSTIKKKFSKQPKFFPF